MASTRRQSQRKARDTAAAQVKRQACGTLQEDADPDSLLTEALKPFKSDESDDWEGWVEVESEPAFFSAILEELGAKDVKAVELMSLDDDTLACLPKPVYGAIFLFEYLPGIDDTTEERDCPPDLWFANQTRDNACATFALLNIIMNAPIDRGAQLQAFYESTRHLTSPLRGHVLSNSVPIRKAHNSFARRMDLLSADLQLQDDADSARSKKKASTKSNNKRGSTATSKGKRKTTFGYHFIAYVPGDNCVWELDGTKTNPHRIGDVDLSRHDWMSLAVPQIQARMTEYEDSQLSFSLIALCHDPIATARQEIAELAKGLHSVRSRLEPSLPNLASTIDNDPPPLNPDSSADLAQFQLTLQQVASATMPSRIAEALAQPDWSSDDGQLYYQQLLADLEDAAAKYREACLAAAEDEDRVRGRKMDYLPAVHCWVKKLAEKGLLHQMIKDLV